MKITFYKAPSIHALNGAGAAGVATFVDARTNTPVTLIALPDGRRMTIDWSDGAEACHAAMALMTAGGLTASGPPPLLDRDKLGPEDAPRIILAGGAA